MAECQDPSLVAQNLPGPRGPKGTTGSTGLTGAAGVSATGTLQYPFVQPPVGDDVLIDIPTTAWLAVGQAIFIETAGYFRVEEIVSPVTARVTRLAIFDGFSDEAETISEGSRVSPAGYSINDPEVIAGLDSRISALEDRLPSEPAKTYRQSEAPTGTIPDGSVWFDSDDNDKQYIWDGSGWAALGTAIQLDDFGTGLRPIQVGNSLPLTGTLGDFFFLTTDKKLYRHTGIAWTAAVAAGDLTGTLPDGAIGADYIIAGMIAAGAINATHIGTNKIIVDGAANIEVAAIKSANIESMAADKITAGTIDSEIIKIKGSTGAVQSDNFVAGSTGFRIKGDGSAEFNDVAVRGTLQAGKVSNQCLLYHPAAPANTFPGTPTQVGIDGTPHNTLGAGGTVINLVTFYGWAYGTGYREDRFGKATQAFICVANGAYTIATGSYAETEIVYRVDGGAWQQVNPFVVNTPYGNGNLAVSGVATIAGLTGASVVEFGVRCKSPNNATSVDVVNLTVTALNF